MSNESRAEALRAEADRIEEEEQLLADLAAAKAAYRKHKADEDAKAELREVAQRLAEHRQARRPAAPSGAGDAAPAPDPVTATTKG